MVWFWKCLESSFSRFVLTSFFPVARSQCYITYSTHYFFLSISSSTLTPTSRGVKADEMIYFYHSLFLVRKRSPGPCPLYCLPLCTVVCVLANGVNKMLLNSISKVFRHICFAVTVTDSAGVSSCRLIDSSEVFLLCVKRDLAGPGEAARSPRRGQGTSPGGSRSRLWFAVLLYARGRNFMC